MGYFNGLVEVSFHKTPEGKEIFNPYGNKHSSYIVNKKQSENIRKFLKRYFIINLCLTAVGCALFKVYSLFFILILIPYYYIGVRKYLKNCQKTEMNNITTYMQRLKNTCLAMGTGSSLFLFIISLVMTLTCIYLLICWGDTERIILSIGGMLIFGACAIQYLLIIILIKKGNNQN